MSKKKTGLVIESNQICYCGFFTERVQRLPKTVLRGSRIREPLQVTPLHPIQDGVLLLC